MGAPRQTQRDRWKKRPVIERYHAFRDELRLQWTKELPHSLRLVFFLPMPPSWSKKKQAGTLHTPHDQKPDIDNLVKAVLDTLSKEDKQVWRVYAEKYWDVEGAIEIKEI
jgi:Holliday junction resolvase RusA-like endonuclease